MSDILNRILNTKVQEVRSAATTMPLTELRAQAESIPPGRHFISAIQARHQQQPAIIAEIKKASPSKGLIRADFNPASLAQAYEKGHATCLSVLTDEQYFQGRPEYIQQAKQACALPVLRKDFIIDAYQIYQAKVWGADAILLIAAALERQQLEEFEALAHELGLSVLLELHAPEELTKCQNLQTPLWGVNNRDLRTFKVDLQQTIQLLPELSGKIVVTESGITSNQDIQFMQQHGVHTFLIGESLMRQSDVTQALYNLMNHQSC